MFIDSAGIHKETYDTCYGQGTLVWCNGKLISHTLPQPTEDRTAGSVKAEKSGFSEPQGGRSRLVGLLERYFAGQKIVFASSLPIDHEGWSGFAMDVAKALLQVPYGSILSYSDLASAAGYPRAQRAVGGFLTRNPFPIIIPCHRVIKSDGSLGGFSSGICWKTRLLELEGVLA